MKERIGMLAIQDRDALGAVRHIASIQIAVDSDWIWVRGIAPNEADTVLMRQLPFRQFYWLDEQSHLFPLNGITPIGTLQKQEWMPIARFIRPELPTSAMPAQVTDPYAVRVVPSASAEKGTALVCSLAVWKAYAESAPEIRLNCLRFAVSDQNQVLIVGEPLPSIPGQEFWQRESLLLPCGYDFEIPFVASLVAGQLNSAKDSLLLFDEEGNWERIPVDGLVPATRSAIRLTKESQRHE